MIKAALLVAALLVLCAQFHESDGKITLGSCRFSCNESEHQSYYLLGNRSQFQGVPGKRGPIGLKGERGVKGQHGFKGDVGVKGDSGAKGELGVKGERGIKGDTGVKGENGTQGIQGEACDCSQYDDLATQVSRLESRLSNTRSNLLRAAGWTKASNSRFYKLFRRRRVDYKTARKRCGSFGGSLASAGMRSTSLRSEIKRNLPGPMPYTWIGLNDYAYPGSRGNYYWSDWVSSSTWNTNWYSGKPTSSYDENCVITYGDSYEGQMADTWCDYKYAYLCEI